MIIICFRQTGDRHRRWHHVLLCLLRSNSGAERQHSDPELLLHANHLHCRWIVLHHVLLLRRLRHGSRHVVPLLPGGHGEKWWHPSEVSNQGNFANDKQINLFQVESVLWDLAFNWTFFLKKWANSGLFLIYFRLFKHTLQFLQQTNVKNGHQVYGAGIWTRNLWNMSQSHITTRPVLPP